MSYIIIPQRRIWTRQPQYEVGIDRSNPITMGLLHRWNLGVSNRDSVSKTKFSITGTPKVATSRIGRMASFSGSPDVIDTGIPTSDLNGKEITISLWARVVDEYQSNSVIFGGETGVSDYRINVHLPYSGTVYWDFGLTDSGGRISKAMPSNYGGALLHWVFLSSNNYLAIYLNGELFHSASVFNNGYFGSGNIFIGALVNGYYFNGSVGNVSIFKRPLSLSEIKSLYQFPWQLDERRSRKSFVDVGGSSTQTLIPDLYSNSQTFYSLIVNAGSITLTPTLLTNTNTFFSPTISLGSVTLSPTLFTNTNEFFSPSVNTSNNLAPSLLTNTQTFFSPTVSPGSISLIPELFVNSQAFYSPSVTQEGGPQYLVPDLLTNTQTFYPHSVIPGFVTLTTSRFDNTNTFYNPIVSQGSAPQELIASLFTNTNDFYSHNLSVGTVLLLASFYENAQTFYSPTVAFVTPPVSGEITLSAQTIADLATAIANAIYAHPEALTASGIADATMLEIDARGYLTTHKYIALK